MKRKIVAITIELESANDIPNEMLMRVTELVMKNAIKAKTYLPSVRFLRAELRESVSEGDG